MTPDPAYVCVFRGIAESDSDRLRTAIPAMADTVGAKRRWVVDILTKVSIIVNQNVAPIIISSVFSGGAGGQPHGQSLTM
jgi:hypothetical protein